VGHGVDANARGIKQRSAIMAATAFNKVETTKLLLENGADPTMRDEDGVNAFDIANDKGNEEVLELLSSHYAPKAK
jgi:ankyrin repeat protein